MGFFLVYLHISFVVDVDVVLLWSVEASEAAAEQAAHFFYS